ncbi:MAG TPA: hypothetical protein VK983_04865 [Candidatus Limnocylindrales bacterium]|nr:hypothetical protein [Candidatus Limnocylindrales bacterium]
MALIQDIASPGPGKEPIRHKARKAAVEQIKLMHQATIIQAPVRSKAFDQDVRPVQAPKPGRYSNFRPHPLLQKHVDEKSAPAKTLTALPHKPVSVPPKQQVMDVSMPGRRRLLRKQAHHSEPVQKPAPAYRKSPIGEMRPLTPQSHLQSHPRLQAPSAHRVHADGRPTPAHAATALKSKKRPLYRKLLDFVQYPLIAVAALAAAFNPTAGQIMIGVYFLLALIFKISSRASFAIALILLLCIPFFQILGQSGTSENVAIYAYEMLAVGTVQAIIELWRNDHEPKTTTS